MKITHRIATEMYEFVEVSIEASDEMSAERIEIAHRELKDAFKPKPINQLPEKEWRIFLEKVMLNEPNHIDQYEKCSPEQKKTINEIKKTLKRLESRQ